MQTEEARSRIRTSCLMVLATIALTFTIYWLRPVLVPAVVAVFVVSGMSPILGVFQKFGVSRLIAAALTFLGGAVFLVIFGCSLWISVIELSSHSQKYLDRVDELLDRIETQLPVSLLAKNDTPERREDARTRRQLRQDQFQEYVTSFVRDGIGVVSNTLISLVSTSVVVLIYVFFLLLGSPRQGTQPDLWNDIEQQIRSYLSLKTVISIFTGMAFGIALRLFGVPMALTFGVLAFLLNFIPNVGPLLASLLPIPLILLDPDHSVGWMIAVITVTSGIQLISGNIIEPRVMGESADLHPVTILLALMFWGMMWGIIGMFLATPIMAGLKIVLDRFEATQPVGALMAGQLPAPPAAESPA